MSAQESTPRKNPIVQSIGTIALVIFQCVAVALMAGAYLLVQHYLTGRPFTDANMSRLGHNIGTFAAGFGGTVGPLLIMFILKEEQKSRAQRMLAGLVAGFILGFSVMRWFSDAPTPVLLGAAVGAVVCACIMFMKSKPAEV